MAKKNPVQLQLTVTISPESFQFLEKASKDGDVTATLSSWATYWLDNQARGGILLEPADHDYLAELNPDKKRFRDSRSLVRAVEKGLKRDEGQFSFIIKVDPAHIQPLEEQARNMGLTTEEAIDGVIQMIFANGWIYEFTPDQGRNIPFTYEMLQSAAALCGKNGVDSMDIAGLIAENRLLPVSRETSDMVKELTAAVEFKSSDIDVLLGELKSARAELTKLRTAPRELVAA